MLDPQENFDRSAALDELENEVWGPPPYPSGLVIGCHRLRTVPLNQFTPNDLRMMIGQHISLPYLVPLALEVLEEDCWAEALYPGGLLCSVLNVPKEYWEAHPHEFMQLTNIFEDVKDYQELYESELLPAWSKLMPKPE